MIELIIMILCLGLNAVLAASEIAFVTLPRVKLKDLAKKGSPAARILLELRQKPERTLSVIQVGITMVGALAAAVGGAQAQESFAPTIAKELGTSLQTARALSMISIVVPWTMLTVVFGELVPKTLALRNPERIGLASAKWLALLDTMFLPLVNFLEWSTKRVLKLLFPRSKVVDENQSNSETVELDSLSHQTRQYVLNLVDLEKKRVGHVYLPWAQVDYLLKDNAIEDVETVVVRSGHTRLPVVDDGQVVGVINTKELLTLIKAGEKDWTTIIRPISKVNEQSSLLMTLRQMQEKRSHLCAVFHGEKLKGIVTMEDILEEVIGEVYDEDDDGALKRILTRRKLSISQIIP